MRVRGHSRRRSRLRSRGAGPALLLIAALARGAALWPSATEAADDAPSQGDSTASTAEPRHADVASQATTQRWSVLPVMGYSTETTLFFGAMAVYYLPPVENTRGSSIPAVGFGSVKGQYQVILASEVYTVGNGCYLEADLTARKWPANFYPRGSSAPYTPMGYLAEGYELSVRVQRRVGGDLYAGPMARFAWEDVSWDPPEGRPVTRGARGGRIAGVGLSASYDTRDNQNAPGAGTLAAYSVEACRSWFGSDFDFEVHVLEARHYLGLGSGRVVALALDLQLLAGRPPFGELSSADGVDQLRGIENGRYRDTHLLSVQTEYRSRLSDRFGFTLFADAARVAREVGDLSPGGMRYSLGGGMRYSLNPQQRFNLRLDAAWVDGGPGFVFTAGEAY